MKKGDGVYNLVVIGAGTAGLVAAAGAVALGARVALVERHKMGGDCLNFGCVPSKALISSARLFTASATPKKWGIEKVEPAIRFRRSLRLDARGPRANWRRSIPRNVSSR